METTLWLRGGRALAAAVKTMYLEGQTDYSLEPVVLADAEGNPIGRVGDGDSVIFCCRRGEREIELTEAFTDRGFDRFDRRPLEGLRFVILTLYHEKFAGLPVAFAPSKLGGTLGETISRAGLGQLRVAESEKFAHVTFFLDGGASGRFPGVEVSRIPSLRGIPFEEAPAMSAAEVARETARGAAAGYGLVVANLANGDVVGHTADFEAKVRAAEAVDSALATIVSAGIEAGRAVFITADHGNIELGLKADGSPNVAHTTAAVPFLALDPAPGRGPEPRDGRLADVAPTLLDAIGVAPPASMSGTTLLPGYRWGGARGALLVILDGWGLGEADVSNPIHVARTPFWDRLVRERRTARLAASGEDVGLGPGKPGNSEAGHLNIGAGRVVPQDDARLDAALRDGTFERNEVFVEAVDAARDGGKALHLIGLLSERSSHGTIAYPLALARMARERGLGDVYIHAILDGRSTEPGSAPDLLERLDDELRDIGGGMAVSCMGRGIALDRAGDYAKIRRAYEALVSGVGRKAATA